MVENKLVNVTIDGIATQVPSNYTIMDAAKTLGIELPRLCFLKDINETSACRVCVVEIEGIRTLKTSCTVKVTDNMVVKTNTKRVKNAVTETLKLIAGNHRFDCWNCQREDNCELLRLLRMYGIENKIGEDETGTYSKKERITNVSDALAIDSSKCLLCGRCISACQHYTGIGVLDFNYRGSQAYVGPALNHPIDNSGCIYCGKCIQSCPTGALQERLNIDDAQELIDNEKYYTVACIAPSVRTALGEEFGYKFGTNVEGKIYEALRKLGFDDITDVNFGADVTIMEEGTEFIGRIQKHLKGEEVVLPMFTSCCPGWIRYIETYYPEFIPHLSSTKSPQQIQGAITKHYYADKLGVKPENIKLISIMPCIAKKYEIKRPEMESHDIRDVDVVITTRELGKWIKRKYINFNDLKDYEPKSALAKFTGAGAIFGATGGVMEAALRTVKDVLEDKYNKEVDIKPVRGQKGIKEATMTIAGQELTIAVVNGAVHIPEMLKRVKKNPSKYAFIEFMACTGGCVNGGGQPIVPSFIADDIDIRKLRGKVLYKQDQVLEFRKSHDNQFVLDMYTDSCLKAPNSKESHHLLHTSYSQKEKYEEQ